MDEIINRYKEMYKAMILKDRDALEEIHDTSFTLTHMTGRKQTKSQYINSVMDGTLNYYEVRHDDIDVKIHGDQAKLIGKSYVLAAVYGSGKSYWHLRQDMSLVRRDGKWYFTSSIASTY